MVWRCVSSGRASTQILVPPKRKKEKKSNTHKGSGEFRGEKGTLFTANGNVNF
jgi:hypothetical protein